MKSHRTIINRGSSEGYDPIKNPKDAPFTFLICEKFDFNLTDLAVTINNIYSDGIHPNHRHNLILSINDGMAAYYSEKDGGIHLAIPYPIFYGKPVKTVISDPSNDNDHIKSFASFMFMGTSGTTLINPDITSYLMSKFSNATYAI